MNRVKQSSWVLSTLLGLVVSYAAGCGDAPDAEGLTIEASFAPGVPRAARDQAVRVEVYLVDSCDSVAIGERPGDPLGSMFVLRDGSGGPAIAVPEAGQYGLYGVAQDSDCTVVGAGCDQVTVDAGGQATLFVQMGAFSGQGCFANQECSIETGECIGPSGDCVDLDSDGLGDGTLDNAGCVNPTTDSNDADGTLCTDTDGDSCDDCSTGSFDPLDDGLDADGDGICDAGDVCVDADGDGFGDGTLGNTGCFNTTTDTDDDDDMLCADTDGDGCDDCSTGTFDPLDDGLDSDADGICDSGDACVDVDGDGLGDGTLGNTGCVNTTTDSNDNDRTLCADTDGDTCDDCAIDAFDPSNDGLDADGDGACALGDCDDDKPLCDSVCTDLDDDGYCIDTDCDDAVAPCDLDCMTNTDNDSHVDCFEAFCGSDPNSNSSICHEVSSQAEYANAINAANNNSGHDYIVLNDFTITSDPPSINDNAGVTIRQVAGATLSVSSGFDRRVFRLYSNNNVIDGVHVVNVSNAYTVVEITGDNNTVRNSEIEGFERRGIYVNGGDDAQVLDNIVSGGTNGETWETAAIVVRFSSGSVISGNTVALNFMDGVQIRETSSMFIDQNTIADNGGSGIEFYGEEWSTGVCVRNNNVTGNGDYGLRAAKDSRVSFLTTSACTAPLSPGPAYGNNDFTNADGSCGGDECWGCSCLPSGLFWEYSIDPLYTSTTPGDQDLYCLDPSSTLVDGGNNLLSYDLNGDAPGDFNGSGPDIGGREDGPGDCN